MRRTALDTSVLVAAIQSWHTDHERARPAVGRVLAEASAVVPFHALVETYSVLTRMPKPLRLSPEQAFTLLDQTLRDKAEVVNLDGDSALALLQSFCERGISGGASYDALIAAVAFHSGAQRLLTLNRRDFERVAPEGLEITVP